MTPELIVATARTWLDTPYRHLAATRGAGCDCLGLIRGVWAELYGELPEVPNYRPDLRDHGDLLAAAQARLLPAPLAAGAIVLCRLGAVPRHCGILTSPTRFIHAQERVGVTEVNLTEGWARRVAGCFAFPEIN